MIQRSKIDVIFQSFWKTSFVTFLRDMSGKDWNPIFRIDRLIISRRKNDDRAQGKTFLAIVCKRKRTMSNCTNHLPTMVKLGIRYQ